MHKKHSQWQLGIENWQEANTAKWELATEKAIESNARQLPAFTHHLISISPQTNSK